MDIDKFISEHDINLVVMDIEGAELELLSNAKFPGVDRLFVELHDFLYDLEGVRTIMVKLAEKGYAYDPLGSCGACVLFNLDRTPRIQAPNDFACLA